MHRSLAVKQKSNPTRSFPTRFMPSVSCLLLLRCDPSLSHIRPSLPHFMWPSVAPQASGPIGGASHHVYHFHLILRVSTQATLSTIRGDFAPDVQYRAAPALLSSTRAPWCSFIRNVGLKKLPKRQHFCRPRLMQALEHVGYADQFDSFAQGLADESVQ